MTHTIETATQAKAFIAAAAADDREAILDSIVQWNNTTDNDIDEDGAVWVSNPQTGHWLDAERIVEFARFIA